jgi:hypothetical protein
VLFCRLLGTDQPGAGEGKINFRAQFESPEMERRFRDHVRYQEIRQATAALLGGAFIALAFIPSDYQILGAGTARPLLAGRVVLAVLSLIILLFFRRIGADGTRSRVLFGFTLCGAALMAWIASTRSSEYFVGQMLTGNFILLLVYLVLPLALPLQVTAAAIFTIDDLTLLLTQHLDINPVVVRAAVVTYVLTNVMGIYTSRNRQHLKREEFALLQREIGLRANLEEALAEVKTLRGILPICSHCKKIRSEDGAWEAMEVYIRSHSEAEFSHGICPDCLGPLLRDLRRPGQVSP